MHIRLDLVLLLAVLFMVGKIITMDDTQQDMWPRIPSVHTAYQTTDESAMTIRYIVGREITRPERPPLCIGTPPKTYDTTANMIVTAHQATRFERVQVLVTGSPPKQLGSSPTSFLGFRSQNASMISYASGTIKRNTPPTETGRSSKRQRDDAYQQQ